MTAVTLARIATSVDMGQQIAESNLLSALLTLAPATVSSLAFSTLRSHVTADRRLPLDRLSRAPWQAQRAVGAWAYRGAALVHRLDLKLPPAPRQEILTVHDLAPLRFDDEGAMPTHAARSLRGAGAIVCPSHFAAGEIHEVFGAENVHVIPNGVPPEFISAVPMSPNDLAAWRISSRYVLHSGGATRRKNLLPLAIAWPEVTRAFPDVTLVLCGPPDPRRTELFSNLPGTRILGRVARAAHVQLTAGAETVVVPSLYEGFGLPVVEAQACGVPVVASRRSSLPEVCGPSDLLVEPTAEGLAEGLCKVLDRPVALTTHGRQPVWTWEMAARAHLELYEACFQ